MKKNLSLLLLIVLLLFCAGCKETIVYHTISFVDERNDNYEDVQVEEGHDCLYPEWEAKEGYYYIFDYSLEELKNIRNDFIVTGTQKMANKIVEYYIDGELVYNFTGVYNSRVDAPQVPASIDFEDWSWEETKTRVGNDYKFVYNLKYTRKENYNISFYDGKELLDLEMKTYNINKDNQLPSYSKEGYEFLGWYPSVISLAKYSEIKKGTIGDVVLYARWNKLSNNNFELPKAKFTFTTVNKTNYDGRPDLILYSIPIPGTAPSRSAGDYEWSTLDDKVALVSEWGSVRIVNGGYVVIQAVLKSNKNIVINGVFLVSDDGVKISSVEEARKQKTYEVKFIGKNGEVIETQNVLEHGHAIYPVPPKYEGFAFVGWDKDNYNIKENTVITALYDENKVNNYQGKRFAIIGDSITTYYSFIPDGYAYFFPYATADVYDVNQTWWLKAINDVGGQLFVDNAYSGSCVSTGTYGSNQDIRLKELVCGTLKPDVIVIYMGANDCGSIYVQHKDYDREYKVMMDKIKELCPESEIILCTLPYCAYYEGKDFEEYNDSIRKYAEMYNCKVCDFSELSIEDKLVDAVHPKKAAHYEMADKLVETLIDEE